MRRMRIFAAVVLASLAVAPASATELQTTAPSAAGSAGQPAKDPSQEIVCEKILVTGSRLGAKKFCGTKQEWAERRLQERQIIDKAQSMPCMVQTTGPSGRPSC